MYGKICECIDNPDIKPVNCHLRTALGEPSKVEDSIYKLADTTFIAQVDCNALGIIFALLKIITDMAKLVERPSDVEPFIPTVMPALNRASEKISDC